MSARPSPGFLLAACLVACRTEQTIVEPDPHLERMLTQEKRLAYGLDPELPRGMVMQDPPGGTMPVDAPIGDPAFTTGVVDGRWVEHFPVAVDRGMIARGRARFDIFCAACHGRLGDGVSVVAEKMALRAPPDLDESRIRAYPPGRLFRVITDGYGLMPSYRPSLSLRDAWEITAYVRALQLSRRAVVAELPPEVRERLAKEAP